MGLPIWVRYTGKRVFRALGYELSRTGQRGSLSGFIDHVTRLGFAPRTVIDVGVAHGTPELYEGFPDAHHLLLEPIEEFQPYLEKLTQRHDAEAVRAAAAAENGTRTMILNPAVLDGGSLLTDRAGIPGQWVERRVPTVRLDTVCGERDLEGPYVIKADVQGTELEVVEGAEGILPDTEVIILEVSLFQFKHGSPELADVIESMKDRGYVTYEMWGPSYRPLDRALAQLDIAFVKESGAFRRSHRIRDVPPGDASSTMTGRTGETNDG